MAEKKIIDWELVEKDWRAGIKTQAQMAAEHAVSRAAMQKRFTKLNIARDLGNKVRAAAASMVAQSVVRPPPLQANTERNHLAPAAEREIVEANAAMQSEIILAHRRNIQRARHMMVSLLNELEFQTDNGQLLRELADAIYNPDDKGAAKRQELFDKVISLGSRAGTMKTLADTLRSLVAMERQAFGLDEKEGEEGDGAVDDLIKRIEAKNGGA